MQMAYCEQRATLASATPSIVVTRENRRHLACMMFKEFLEEKGNITIANDLAKAIVNGLSKGEASQT